MRDLEPLEAVTGLGLLANDIKDGVNEFGALSVVALSPVISRARLPKDKVVWPEELAEGACPDGVHRSWFEVD
ncbi:MAG: hypothetical protein BJ554DRAFT_2984 [Olpidium bornovanus]|uniref:Uncharacterized protein n=1 Tax=Olpidium bornovanus TaxID=278681 RepID=A0A8H7ZQ73_9FUNG|nr:MAG: hypothetical protein BJ554DRAFT_2984 [Olpidium bornovanus]